jgi:hypothetical protein
MLIAREVRFANHFYASTPLHNSHVLLIRIALEVRSASRIHVSILHRALLILIVPAKEKPALMGNVLFPLGHNAASMPIAQEVRFANRVHASILQHNHATSILTVPAKGKHVSMESAPFPLGHSAVLMPIAQEARSANRIHVSILHHALLIPTAPTQGKPASTGSAPFPLGHNAAWILTALTQGKHASTGLALFPPGRNAALMPIAQGARSANRIHVSILHHVLLILTVPAKGKHASTESAPFPRLEDSVPSMLTAQVVRYVNQIHASILHRALLILIVPAKGKPASMGSAVFPRQDSSAVSMLTAREVRSASQAFASILQRSSHVTSILTATVGKPATMGPAALLHREGTVRVLTQMTAFFQSILFASLGCVFVLTRSVHRTPTSGLAKRTHNAALAHYVSKEYVLIRLVARELRRVSHNSMFAFFQAYVSVSMAFAVSEEAHRHRSAPLTRTAAVSFPASHVGAIVDSAKPLFNICSRVKAWGNRWRVYELVTPLPAFFYFLGQGGVL